MLINITNAIVYDTDLDFDGQTQECQDYINNLIVEKQPLSVWDVTNRPEMVWSCGSYEVVKVQLWINTTDWQTTGEKIIVRERSVE